MQHVSIVEAEYFNISVNPNQTGNSLKKMLTLLPCGEKHSAIDLNSFHIQLSTEVVFVFSINLNNVIYAE